MKSIQLVFGDIGKLKAEPDPSELPEYHLPSALVCENEDLTSAENDRVQGTSRGEASIPEVFYHSDIAGFPIREFAGPPCYHLVKMVTEKSDPTL